MTCLIQKFFASDAHNRPSLTLEEVMFKAYENTFADLPAGRTSLRSSERNLRPAPAHIKRPGLFD